jgi:hypothetical protein
MRGEPDPAAASNGLIVTEGVTVAVGGPVIGGRLTIRHNLSNAIAAFFTSPREAGRGRRPKGGG